MIFLIWLVVCSLISLNIIRKYLNGPRRWPEDVYIGIFSTFVWGELISVIVGGIIFLSGVGSVKVDDPVKIVSLRDRQGLSGSFILGSRIVGTRNYYFVMVSDGDGGYKRKEVPSDDVSICESDASPHIVMTSYKLRGFIIFPWRCDTLFHSEYTKIVVPRGTIVESFDKL